jgi:DNA-binding GntR family transcriptional regulator
MSNAIKADRFARAAEPDKRLSIARRTSLGDEVYETLLAQLVALRIPPNARISVDALVRELGVSQTPIRAALIRLENEGLVVKTHNVGYSAAPMPSRDKFEQIYDLRLLLEPYAAEQACQKLGSAARDDLAELALAMTEPDPEDAERAYGKFALHDAKFHALIATQSGNLLVAEALARSYAHSHLFRLRYHAAATEGAVEEHAKIISAMAASDSAGARAAMEEHIVRSRARWRPYFVEMT